MELEGMGWVGMERNGIDVTVDLDSASDSNSESDSYCSSGILNPPLIGFASRVLKFDFECETEFDFEFEPHFKFGIEFSASATFTFTAAI